MLTAGWTSVCPAEIGSGVPLRYRTPGILLASPSRLQVHFSLNIAAVSGGGTEATSRVISGDFAGLSALKEQLEGQAQPGSVSGPGRVAGLCALKEQMMFEKRATPAPLLLEPKKAANANNSEEKGRGSVGLLVSNLPKELTRAEYESFMQQIPEISSCTFLNHRSGRCRGYGFCEVRPGADAAIVTEFIRSQTLGGRAVKASVAIVKKDSDKDAKQEEVRPKSVREKPKAGAASIQEKPRRTSSDSDAKLKVGEKIPKATLQVKNAGRAGSAAQQQQLDTIKRLDGDGPGKNSNDFSKKRNEGGLEAPEFQQQQSGMTTTTASDSDGRLSGQSVLAALERFASAGRPRQRRATGPPARLPSSKHEDDTENSDETQFIEFKLDWAERIQSLEASIEQLQRL